MSRQVRSRRPSGGAQGPRRPRSEAQVCGPASEDVDAIWSVREAPGRFGVKSTGFAPGRHGVEREEEDRAQRAGHTADIQQAFVR